MFYLAGVSKISIVMRSNNIDRRSYLSSTPAVMEISKLLIDI